MADSIRVTFVEPAAPESGFHSTDASFEVERVPGPSAALDAVESGEVDCLVTGYDLATTTGIDLLERVRDDRPAFPVVLYTDRDGESVASEALAADVTDVVRAGEEVAPRLLARRVEHAVSTYRSERTPPRQDRDAETAEEGVGSLDDDGPDRDGDVTEERDGARTGRADQAFLQRLYEITASTGPFETKLERALDLGREYFDLEVGCLARVDPERDHFEVEYARGDHDHLAPGTEVPLSETYCQLVADERDAAEAESTQDGLTPIDAETRPDGGATVDVSDPREAGLTDSIAAQTFGVQRYVGTDLTVDGDLYGTLFFASTTDGEEIPDRQQTFVHLMGQWLSSELARRRRERRLTALNDVTRELMNAESPDEMFEELVDDAASILELPAVAVARADEETGELQPVGETGRGSLPVEELCATDRAAWEAFVTGETHVVREVEAHEAAVVVPLDEHGVLVAAVAAVDTGAFLVEFVETVGATVASALDRADRERLLREREATLQRQNEAMERLNRINDIIRNIDQGLVSATSREEIERLVCEELAERGPYELAWIGEETTVTDEVIPRAAAGNEKGYLDQVTITTGDGPEGRGPIGTALQTFEPQVVQNTLTDSPFEPWRQAALNRGYRSVLALPLEYDGTVYGVLTVYAGETEAFDELAQSVIAELSETVAYAINAVESKRGLVSGSSVELELSLDTCELAHTAGEFDTTATLEGMVSEPEDGIRSYISLRDVDVQEVREHEDALPFEDPTVTNHDDGVLVEGVVDGDSFCRRVLDHGGVVHDVTATAGGAEARVSISSAADVREFVETVQRWYPGTRLDAKRERDQPLRTRQDLWGELLDRLTERQRTVLETAYFSGYFETPRQATGTEVADRLGVSQPTFNDHLRSAQRKLYELLMADEGRLQERVGSSE